MRHIRPEQLPADPNARDALARFCKEARSVGGDRVRQIIVYGSMARGDAGPESDLDVWVDWTGDEAEGRRLLVRLGGQLFVETGVLVSVHVVSESRRRQMAGWNTQYYRNVHTDGVVVDA